MRLSALLTPPVFPGDEQKSHRARLLHYALLLNVGMMAVCALCVLLSKTLPAQMLWLEGGLAVVSLMLRRWVQRGWVDAAGGTLLGLGFATTTAAVACLGTIRVPVTGFYLVLVVGAGIVFDLAGVVVFTVAASLAVAGLIWAENAGWLPRPDLSVSVVQWIVVTATQFAVGGWTLAAVHSIRSGLRQAEREGAERQRAETALRESEERHRNILRTAMDGFWLLDDQLRILEVNTAYCRLSGYTEDELRGRPARDLEADAAPAEAAVRLAGIRRLGEARFESRHRRKDGGIFDVEISMQYRDEAEGRLVVFLRDITEAKRSVETIRESNERFELAAQATHEALWDWKFATDQVWWNSGVTTLFGHTPDAAGASSDWWWEKLHPDDRERVRESFFLVVNGREEYWSDEYRFRRADGSYAYVFDRGIVRRDASGQATRMLGAIIDLTERKRAEEALRESEARLRAIIEATPVAMLVNDAEDRITFFNRKFAEVFGYARQDIPTMAAWWPKAFPDEAYREWVRGEWRDALARPRPVGAEVVLPDLRVHGRDGSIRDIRLSAAPMGSAQLVILYDLTESKRNEKERDELRGRLTQAQKMESIGRLAGGVAHDFNNMLTAILGNTEMAQLGVADHSPLRDHLDQIESAARRSADLTRQLLAFARKQTVAPRVVELNAAVEGMLKMLRRLIGEDIELVWRPAPGGPMIRIDPSQLDQIVANLCVNARDAIGGVGRITLETDTVVFDAAQCAHYPDAVPGDYVLLAIGDNGCGMDAELLAHVFEPFFTTKDAGRGTGLGLATVYGIVRQNDGFIDVTSEPRRGTTFRIYLPRHAETAAPGAKPGPVTLARGGGETILLVEDEPSILLVGRMILERLGYNVLAAATPSDGLRLARAHAGKIDLLLTDVVMPGMNGLDLAKQLRAQYPKLRLVFMSGYTASVLAPDGILPAAVHFVHKPFTTGILAEKIRLALEREPAEI